MWALACALFGLICCPVTSPIACWLGWTEAQAVRRGESVVADATMATISLWLGVLGTLLGVLSVAVVLLAAVTMLVLAR